MKKLVILLSIVCSKGFAQEIKVDTLWKKALNFLSQFNLGYRYGKTLEV